MPIFPKNIQRFVWLPVLFFILTVGSVGGLCLIKINIRNTVREMIGTLTDAELVPVEMTYTSGAENKDELLLGGKYYDVARCRMQDGKITYYCYYDKAETAIASLWSGSRFPRDCSYQANQTEVTHKDFDPRFISRVVVPKVCFKALFINYFPRIYTLSSIPGDVFTPPPQG